MSSYFSIRRNRPQPGASAVVNSSSTIEANATALSAATPGSSLMEEGVTIYGSAGSEDDTMEGAASSSSTRMEEEENARATAICCRPTPTSERIRRLHFAALNADHLRLYDVVAEELRVRSSLGLLQHILQLAQGIVVIGRQQPENRGPVIRFPHMISSFRSRSTRRSE